MSDHRTAHADGVQVVVTTAPFRKGQAAARADFKRDPHSVPNDAVLDRIGGEFAAGYRYEWREYCATAPTDVTA